MKALGMFHGTPMYALLHRAFARPNPARELALQGVAKRRQSVREVAARIRDELGMAPDPRLSA